MEGLVEARDGERHFGRQLFVRGARCRQGDWGGLVEPGGRGEVGAVAAAAGLVHVDAVEDEGVGGRVGSILLVSCEVG